MTKALLPWMILSFSAASSFGASPAEELAPFLGNFRTRAYNGLENNYSGKFFLPSVHLEPSNKIRDEQGRAMQALHFNFEVPVQTGENEISLKFLFAEMPVDPAFISAEPGQAEILFSGEIQELIQREWISCQAEFRAGLKMREGKHLTIDFRKKAEAPCSSEEHLIEAERVIF